MKILTRLLAVSLLALAGFSAQAQTPNPAAIPTLRNDWLVRHEGFNAIAKQGGVDLLFVGDSITDGWRNGGKVIWQERYAPLHAANFGIGGDKTEHVLWRLQNGNLDGIRPKVVVLMIGTNNVGRDSAEQIAGGVTAIVQEIRKRTPSSKILLLGIFPRADKADNPLRVKNAEATRLFSALDDGKHVFFLDIGAKFLQPDGTLPKEIMPDLLHPNAAGYAIWADAIQAKLDELMK